MVHLVQNIASKNQVTITFTEHDMDIVFFHFTTHCGASAGAGACRWQAGGHQAEPGSENGIPRRRDMVLKVSDIHTYYGDAHILYGVSLEVEKGEIVCLLGRNGAGKSTTMKSIR